MTYSIIGRDPATGEIGLAVQSRYFAAGRVVPYAEGGVGVIASQAFLNPVYGYKGLALLREDQAPQAIMDRLTAEDAGSAMRQVAIMDDLHFSVVMADRPAQTSRTSDKQQRSLPPEATDWPISSSPTRGRIAPKWSDWPVSSAAPA